MRLTPRLATGAVATAALLVPGLAAGLAAPGAHATPAATSTSADADGTRLQDWLADQLAGPGDGELTVIVHGADLAAADAAVEAAGLERGTSFDRIGVVVARGTADQIAAVGTQPGVTYVEGNRPVELLQEPPTPPPAAPRRSRP